MAQGWRQWLGAARRCLTGGVAEIKKRRYARSSRAGTKVLTRAIAKQDIQLVLQAMVLDQPDLDSQPIASLLTTWRGNGRRQSGG